MDIRTVIGSPMPDENRNAFICNFSSILCRLCFLDEHDVYLIYKSYLKCCNLRVGGKTLEYFDDNILSRQKLLDIIQVQNFPVLHDFLFFLNQNDQIMWDNYLQFVLVLTLVPIDKLIYYILFQTLNEQPDLFNPIPFHRLVVKINPYVTETDSFYSAFKALGEPTPHRFSQFLASFEEVTYILQDIRERVRAFVADSSFWRSVQRRTRFLFSAMAYREQTGQELPLPLCYRVQHCLDRSPNPYLRMDRESRGNDFHQFEIHLHELCEKKKWYTSTCDSQTKYSSQVSQVNISKCPEDWMSNQNSEIV